MEIKGLFIQELQAALNANVSSEKPFQCVPLQTFSTSLESLKYRLSALSGGLLDFK